MNKNETVLKLSHQGIIAVVRGKTMEDGVKIADACIAGGVKAIELAFTTPHAPEAITTLVEKYKDDADVIIGAGTVLDTTSARLAILAGAQFIVSPAFDKDVVEMCNLYRVVSCPGVMDPTGVVAALKAGADIVKIFPGDIVGTKMIKDVHGPLPPGPSVQLVYPVEDAGEPLGHAGGSHGPGRLPRVRRVEFRQRPHPLRRRRHPRLHRQAAVISEGV